MKEKLIKSKERVKKHGEVFTPKHIVSEMLDLVPDASDPYKTVLEPACGNGNFLVQILERKLKNVKTEKDFLHAISSIYGVDIMQDNVDESIIRMFEVISKSADDLFPLEYVTKNFANIYLILHTNIIKGNFLQDTIKFAEWEFLPDIIDGEIFYTKFKRTWKEYKPDGIAKKPRKKRNK